ncbi:hypothetical protein [Nocardia mexicana]|nr:hypothetical protein [Nocardia mexicana]
MTAAPRRRRREWTPEELEWLDKTQERLSGPLTEWQLSVLRYWWNGGYARDDNSGGVDRAS